MELVTPGPSAEHMAAWGLEASDFENDVFEVWPDNWRAVCMFDDLGLGAWSVGQYGFLGLRPEALREVRLLHRVPLDEWPSVFRDLKVMEQAALPILNKPAK